MMKQAPRTTEFVMLIRISRTFQMLRLQSGDRATVVSVWRHCSTTFVWWRGSSGEKV